MFTRRRVILILAGLLLAFGALCASYFHWLPGGWFLRSLLEDPAARTARVRDEHRTDRLEAFAREPLPDGPALVFLGSSTVERFPLGRHFPRTRTVNRGIGEEAVAELAARCIAHLPPAVVGFVIYAGSVDFHRDRRDAAFIRERVGRLLDVLRKARPDADQLVLGVLPARDLDEGGRRRLAAYNDALAAAARAAGAGFLPTGGTPITDPDGRLAAAASADRWHLNDRGYEELTRRLAAHPAARSMFKRASRPPGHR